MTDLDIDVLHWLAPTGGDPSERETTASLRIAAGGRLFTEVEDLLAHTVRGHINVPAVSLARWLLINWWRLRWEPWRESPSHDWRMSHSMAAISGSDAWPDLDIASDGEFIRLQVKESAPPHVCGIRYLRSQMTNVPAHEFERAVDAFVSVVQERLAVRAPEAREIAELAGELLDERRSPEQARACKIQALSGMDPGDAPASWLAQAERLVGEIGEGAADEVFPTLPSPEGIAEATETVQAMQRSKATICFDEAITASSFEPGSSRELPWQRGVRFARELRRRLSLSSGPIEEATFEQLFNVKLPLAMPSSRGLLFKGGYHREPRAPMHVLFSNERETSQRFLVARLVAAKMTAKGTQRLFPVSDAKTAFQKYQRAFAQEFLCPSADLEAFTREHGTGEEAIADAAEFFNVSEQVVIYTLKNRGQLPWQSLDQR